MSKLFITMRDGVVIIDMDKIAYVQADGNYSKVCYICGDSLLLTMGLAKVEDTIRNSWPPERFLPFVRMGRSLIINQTYLAEVRINTQKIVLSDNVGHRYTLSVPKPVLKKYRENIYELYVKNIAQ